MISTPRSSTPVEPPTTDWVFPPASTADGDGVVGLGADLEPGTLLTAYRSGLFPMPLEPGGTIAWWSPDPRAVLPIDALIVSRSLRRSCRRYTVTVDRCFEAVVSACADLPRPHGWIDDQMADAYLQLHRLGWAHSVETWDGDRLVGGLYGVAIGSFFAGESMFHVATDASKVALVGLVELLGGQGAQLLDVQWLTPHLSSLGAVAIDRNRYVRLLGDACTAQSVWPLTDREAAFNPGAGRPMERR